MATVTRPSKSLPDPGDALDAEPIRDYITNILSFLESTNIDEGNVDLSGSDGILGKSTAQTATGLKTWEQTTAAAASVIDVAIFQWDPSSGTTSDNQGMRLSFKMDDDAGNQDEVGAIDLVETDVSATTEDAEWQFHAVAAGSLTKSLTVGGTGTTSHLPLTVGVDGTGYDVKFFGDTPGAYMEWDESADQLRIMGASADATTSTGKLLLATSLTDINANDVLGKIDFQAPHEAGGTDATAIAASIQAVAQDTFAASVNATDLIFYTGHSEAATEKVRITSQGEIGIGGANYGTDGQVLTSGGAGVAPAWETPTTGDITGVTAGVGLSGGGPSGGVTLTLDLSELSAVTPASGDWFATLDSDGANEQLTTTDALATLFAGTGLTASSAVIGVDASQTQITAVGTVTSGTWSTGAVIGGATVTVGSDATGDVYYRNASGVFTRLAAGSDADVLTLASGIPSWATPTSGDVTAVTAGNGLSGGGTSGGVSLALDLSELADTAIADGDYIVFTDTTDSNASVKGDLADVATLFAGTGLTASSSVIGVDASQTQITEVGTITTGTWSGVIDGSCTMTLGSDATGDIYYRDASGFLEKLAASTDGYVLTSTGAGAIPAWEAIPGGGISFSGSTADGMVTYGGSSSAVVESTLTFASDVLTATSTSSNLPKIELKNTNADATAGIIQFSKDSASGAASDVMGTVSFYGTDASNNTHEEFAKIEGIVETATAGQEGGQIKFSVASHDAELNQGLLIEDGSAEDEVDVTIGNGSASVVTLPGNISITGDASVGGILSLNAAIASPLKVEVTSGTVWSLGWFNASDGSWWLLGRTADVASFTRAQANFYIPTGSISDVPAS